jgi:hypothetical protein
LSPINILGQRLSLQRKHREYDTVLRDHGCRTAQKAVADVIHIATLLARQDYTASNHCIIKNYELKMKWKRATMTYLRYYTGNSFDGLRNTTKHLIYSSFSKATRGLEPNSYRGALQSTLLHATVYVFTQFAECTGTDCK